MPGVDLDRWRRAGAAPAGGGDPPPPWDHPQVRAATAAVQDHLRRTRAGLLDPTATDAAFRQELAAAVRAFLDGRRDLWPPGWSLDQIAGEVLAHISGLGPLGPLLDDPAVAEVMVNAPDQVWVERHGRLERVPVRFRDDAHVLGVAQRLLAPLGVELSASQPLAEGRLPGNIRLAASVPPASPRPTFSLRLPARNPLGTDDYVERGTATHEMLAFLQACARGRANLLIAGPTGSGKTTLLRYIGQHLDPTARVVVLEQVPELGLEQLHPHAVSLVAHPPGPEGRGGVDLADLLRHALHRRPDYLVVGEVLGAEAITLLAALASGHAGACTVHAAAPERVFDRLALAMLTARLDISRAELLHQAAEAIDVVCFIERMADGSRKLTHIAEVAGAGPGGPEVRPLWRFQPHESSPVAVRGRFLAVGAPSDRLRARLARWGVYLP